jgi:hypothetical protein
MIVKSALEAAAANSRSPCRVQIRSSLPWIASTGTVSFGASARIFLRLVSAVLARRTLAGPALLNWSAANASRTAATRLASVIGAAGTIAAFGQHQDKHPPTALIARLSGVQAMPSAADTKTTPSMWNRESDSSAM